MPHNRGKSREEVLRRTFGDLEIREAEDDIRVRITPEIVESTKRSDDLGHYGSCVLAEATKALLGSKSVVFLRTIAYIDVVGSDGVRRCERFWLSPDARAVVEAFDRSDPVPEDGRMVVLKAMPKHRQLEHSRKRNQRRRDAIIKGDAVREKRGSYAPRNDIEGEIRNGSGHVHFIERSKVA